MNATDEKTVNTMVVATSSAEAKIETVNWPSKLKVNTYGDFGIKAVMEGGSSVMCLAIVNNKNNGGNMYINLGDSVRKVPPGYALVMQTNNPVCNGCAVVIMAKVKFDKEGDYEVDIYAGVP